jgi:hypothetical protein
MVISVRGAQQAALSVWLKTDDPYEGTFGVFGNDERTLPYCFDDLDFMLPNLMR